MTWPTRERRVSKIAAGTAMRSKSCRAFERQCRRDGRDGLGRRGNACALQHSRNARRPQMDGDAARCVQALGLLAREQDDIGQLPHRTGPGAALECLEAFP